MADLVERLRAHLDGDKLHAFDSMLAEDVEEAVDEIESLRRDVAYEQSRADRLIDTMHQARLELYMLKVRIEAAKVGWIDDRKEHDDGSGYVSACFYKGVPKFEMGKRVRLVVEE